MDRDLQQHQGHTHEDQVASGVFDAWRYCYHCDCELNVSGQPETREAEPQTCAKCAAEVTP
jgi:hypothetical protein